MRLLWIEDFGAGLQTNIAVELFSDLVGQEHFDDPTRDKKIEIGLPRLFEASSLHEIAVCRSFDDWQQLMEQGEHDFDVAIIDINLERGPATKPPLDVDDFEKKAGLYIYHELIRSYGFCDQNIAFFTGEEMTVQEFRESCIASMLQAPKNCFEKKGSAYPKIRAFLRTQADSPYLRLRRGILDGIGFLRHQMENTPVEDLEARFPLFRPLSSDRRQDRALYRNQISRFLSRLTFLLPMSPPDDLSSHYLSLLTELTNPWSRAPEPVVLGYRDPGHTAADDLFAGSSAKLLSLINDWASRGLLPEALAERDVAFVVLLAARSWTVHPEAGVERYERQLLDLLPEPIGIEDFDRLLRTQMESLLAVSYESLTHEARLAGASLRHSADFVELCSRVATRTEAISYEERSEALLMLREKSLELLYRAFWHGLTPIWVDSYTGNTYLSFKPVEIPETSLLRSLGSRITASAFGDRVGVPASA